MDTQRKFDSKLAHRELRSFLYDTVEYFDVRADRVPHTFETHELLDFAAKFSRRRDVRDSDVYHDLLQRLAVLAFIVGDAELGRKTITRGLRDAEEGPERARFLYLSGLYDHFRSGDLTAAKEVLEQALVESELSRHLKSDVRIALGRTCREVEEYEAAERHYQHLIDHGVLELRPTAVHLLALVREAQGRLDEAENLTRESLKQFEQERDWLNVLNLKATLGDLALTGGDGPRARRVLEPVAEEYARILSAEGAARTYGTLAATYAKEKKYPRALSAYAESLRFQAPAHRYADIARTYRNMAGGLPDMGKTAASLAAFDRAVEFAQRADAVEEELSVYSDVLSLSTVLKLPPAAIAHVVERSREILTEADGRLSGEVYERFAKGAIAVVGRALPRVTRRRGAVPALGTSVGRGELSAIVGEVSEKEFDAKLEARLQPGLGIRHAPSPDLLGRFLMLFAGDRFKFANYANEFSLSQGRAKPHLRILCERDVIQLSGQRKASSYTLAFHREA